MNVHTSRPPRLTVGFPVFNGEQFMRQSIESVLSQSFGDFELVICDNASEDGTEDISREFVARDERVSYHRNERNLGAAGNYNRVFSLATGEFFKWTTHDDYLLPGHFEKCIEALDADPAVILAYPRTILVDEHGENPRQFDEGLHLMADEPFRRLNKLVVDIRLCSAVVGIIRREVLGRTRLIDKFSGSDFILLVELATLGKFFEVPDYLYCRRDHPLRSLRKNTSQADIDRWFDPDSKKSTRFPKVRLFREQLKSVSRMPLPAGSRALCYLQVARWVLKRWQVTGGRYKRQLKQRLGVAVEGR